MRARLEVQAHPLGSRVQWQLHTEQLMQQQQQEGRRLRILPRHQDRRRCHSLVRQARRQWCRSQSRHSP